VLRCHELLGKNDPPAFPQAGAILGELRLLYELGRGARGRVFLATQPSLSDRPLAVKITARNGQEHLSLARLQHTNIVPLYHVLDFPTENLRAMCMPFLGGATWSAILQRLQKRPLAQRRGEHLAGQLAELQKLCPVPVVSTGPALAFLAQSSFVDAVCWMGACLADALYYAHQRGLVHLDIKPSNVLVTADGQPMLLDFHIACPLEQIQNDAIDRMGGTPEYMSPEQRAAVEAIRRGNLIDRRLDGRSDLESAAEHGVAPGEAHYQIARLKLAQNNLAQASRWLQRSLTDDPDHADAIALQKELAVRASR
jgi:serine/threonine protein kinase